MKANEQTLNEAPVPVVIMGLGPVGTSIAQRVLQCRDLELVAVLEVSPELVGRQLGDLLEGSETGLVVTSDQDTAFEQARNGVVIQATGSRLSDVAPEVLAALRAGLSVISTCSELACPWLENTDLAETLHQVACEQQKTVLGTGVNPGFALDRLVSCAGTVSGNIRHVHARRVVDIANRRMALLNKAGVGLPVAEFLDKGKTGVVGHRGLNHSAVLAATGLGLEYDDIREDIEPVISDKKWTGAVSIQPGQVAGYRQSACVLQAGRELIRLDLTYAVDVINNDSILIEADPVIDLVIRNGVSGDAATAWSAINAVPAVLQARPGLLSVLDLPPAKSTTIYKCV